MTEELYEMPLQLILNAGDSRSHAMLAIQAAREFRFSDAEKEIENAQESMLKAHNSQTEALQAEAQGEQTAVNLLMVHAQDHLTMAMITLDFAKESLCTYRMIHDLQKK